MRLPLFGLLTAIVLSPLRVAEAQASDPVRPNKDLSITTSPGISFGKNEFSGNVDVSVLARLRWLMVGASLDSGYFVERFQYSGALHAGFGGRGRHWTPPPAAATCRGQLLGTFRVRHYISTGGENENDHGRSFTVPFVGARAGISFIANSSRHTHVLFGLSVTLEAPLGSTTFGYDYIDDYGSPVHKTLHIGGPRVGLMFDLGLVRDLRAR
jgi:hypothetical protein